jgi:hypothetical protein
MSPVSRLERLPAPVHELIPGSAGLSLSSFALGPFSSRQRHPLSRFCGQSPHAAYKRRDLTPSGWAPRPLRLEPRKGRLTLLSEDPQLLAAMQVLSNLLATFRRKIGGLDRSGFSQQGGE